MLHLIAGVQAQQQIIIFAQQQLSYNDTLAREARVLLAAQGHLRYDQAEMGALRRPLYLGQLRAQALGTGAPLLSGQRLCCVDQRARTA